MIKDSLAKRLANWYSPASRRGSGKKKPASCKLSVETLEDRVVPTAGPVALPLNYALQPGFTAITDISQITGPGKYQLTADSNSGIIGETINWDDVTLDGGGHTVCLNYSWLSINGQRDVVKNCVIPGAAIIHGAGVVFSNNWLINSWAANLEIDASGCTIANNLIVGSGFSTDDNVVTNGDLSNLNFVGNVINGPGGGGCYDVGIEGIGSWTNCTFNGNVITNGFRGAIGGWYGDKWPSPGPQFHITNCTFENNFFPYIDAYGLPIEFTIAGGSSAPGGAYDDHSATSQWGWDGNTFTGDTFAPTPTPPSITSQPTNEMVSSGQSATISVTASSTGPLFYQWRKLVNGAWTNIGGFTSSPTLTINSAQTADAGQYEVVVSNALQQQVVSNTVSLTVDGAVTAPSITQQPTSQTVSAGQSATFSVTASGTAPLSYQWQKLVSGNWVNISGATSPTFTRSSAQASDAGQYEVVVTNSAGTVVSNTVALTVQVQGAPLPAGWTDADIGSVPAAGSASYDSGTTTWTVKGSGMIYGTSDTFNFARVPMTGDGSIVAQISGVTAAKAGLMYRDGTAANAVLAGVYVYGDGSAYFQARTSVGAAVSELGGVTGLPSTAWLKLTRARNNFTAYYSTDGNNWNQIGNPTSVTMSSTVQAGLAVCGSSLNTATYNNVRAVAANAVVTAPTIAQQPTSLTVNAGDSASFSVTATGTTPLSYQWQKLVNGTWVDISGATSPTFTLGSAPASDAGQYQVAVSNAAGQVVSNTVALTVNGAATYTLSASPSAVAPGGTITANWTAPADHAGTWIGLFAVGGYPYYDYRWISSGTSGSVTFTAPATPGSYEVRYLVNNASSYTILATSNPVQVQAITGDSITVHLSEDAFHGDAQYLIAVDGQQIGGVRTETALHSQGQSEAVVLGGPFAPGPHTVTITFLNDAYAGTPDTDRNLYVDSIDFQGINYRGAALYSAGSQDFRIG